MQPTLCTRCHKNVAVIFVTKIEHGETKNEGLCLKCARELGIKPVDDMMKKMGISDDDLESISNEMLCAFGGAECPDGLADIIEDSEEDDGRTATFPFLNKLFGAQNQNQSGCEGEQPQRPNREDKSPKGERPQKRKFLEN